MAELPWKKIRLILAIILVVGMIRMPMEQAFVRQLQEDGFHPKLPQTPVMEQIGVQSSIGLLGGLRYMVASLMELQAFAYWSALPKPRWEELSDTYNLITTLQPKDEESWSLYCWHMAYNGAAWYVRDEPDMTEGNRQIMINRYHDIGRDILLRGIQWNPESVTLYRDIASLYEKKFSDRCKAAEWYYKGSKIPKAPSYFYRFYAYNLAKCPGKEEEAYQVLMELYEQGKRVLQQQQILIWKPSLISSIKDLEIFLDVPEAQRIPEYLDPRTIRIVSPLIPQSVPETTE